MRGNSGQDGKIARNCLVSTLNRSVMQMSKVICEKGYCLLAEGWGNVWNQQFSGNYSQPVISM